MGVFLFALAFAGFTRFVISELFVTAERSNLEGGGAEYIEGIGRSILLEPFLGYTGGTLSFDVVFLSRLQISEPTRLGMMSYGVLCLKK